jgi:hypothetical protein
VWVKAKGGFPSKGFACVAQAVPDVVARDEGDQLMGMGVNGVDFGVGSRVWDVAKDPLHDGDESKHGAEVFVIRPWLRPGVHFVPILLVYKGDGDVFGFCFQILVVMI